MAEVKDRESDGPPAGRELDALVAERFFGWRWHTFLGTSYLLHPSWIEALAWPGSSWTEGKAGEPDFEWDRMGRDHAWRAVKPYSTRIDAAWEIVEELGRRLLVALVSQERDAELRIHYEVLVGHGKGNPKTDLVAAGKGETAALAISRAAIAYVDAIAHHE